MNYKIDLHTHTNISDGASTPIVSKYNLLYSGGTDYHGSNRPDIKIGSGKDNNISIPYSVYENIINSINRSNNSFY